MSVETTMYTLKPIVLLPDKIYHSKTMYKMRNIHEGSRRDDHTAVEMKIVPNITEQLQSKLPEFSALEARQVKILAQLAELKKQVSTLRNVLKQTNPLEVAAASKPQPVPQEAVNVNIILNVHPKRPPYSLLALRKLWKDTEVQVKTYVHSSIKSDVPNLYNQQDAHSSSVGAHIVNLSVIWKEVEDLEVVLGLHSYHIKGEANFLRYLSRIIYSHSYENLNSVSEINSVDTVLDLCYALQCQESAKERQEIVSSIASKLVTNQNTKAQPTIADIAAWSTLKQVFPKNVPPVINKWFQSREQLFM